MKPPYVFCRDDDVWSADDVFQELSDVFVRENVPIVYGVVPALVDPGFVRFMLRGPGKNALADIAQHGWLHEDYSGGAGDKYEFGAVRSYADQYRDMRQGKVLLGRLFGRKALPVFIPPFHGFDEATLRVVRSLKFKIFSAGQRAFPVGGSVLDLPASMALNDYAADGAPLPLDERAMLRRLRSSLSHRKLLGFVYHHRVIKKRSQMTAMKRFIGSLARLRDKGEIKLFRFSDVINRKVL